MAYQETDIDTMLADSPDTITVAGVTTPCVFIEHHEVVLEHEGAAGQIVLVSIALVKRADFPNVKGDDACVVNGANYKVWRRLRVQDGAMTELYLRQV